MDKTFIVAQITEWLGVVAVAWLLSLSPRFKNTQVGFRYVQRERLAALTIAAIAILFSLVFSTTGVGDTLSRYVPFPGVAAALDRPVALAVFTLLPAIAALVMRGQPARSVGWNREMLRAGVQVGLALVLLTIFLRNRVVDVLSGVSTDQTWYLIGAVIIAVAEETVFRGYIQLRFQSWLGDPHGWVVTALVYAVWRLPGLLAGASLPTVLIGLALALGQGLACGFLMRKSGHLLAPVLYRATSIWLNVFI